MPADAHRTLLETCRDHPDQVVVALDFDGTLAPIVDDPEQARPLPQAGQVLRELGDRVGLVAVVTGRPARTVVRLGSLEALTGHAVVVRGAYGAERWDARTGQYDDPPPPPEIERARELLTELVGAEGGGVALEDKGRALAVHTRRAGDPGGAFTRLRPKVAQVADELGLRFEPGRLVLEVRQRGADKGQVVHDLVQETRARAVVYVGDDLGDEPAFRALHELRGEGVTTLGVGVRSTETEWPEGLVDVLVDGPEGVLELLRGLTTA